ncbi:MAG: hypothetical protein N3E48_00770 [Candidatus Bathyarchaeota archaeon]|nr:hypothetical protein [Candidatus Bathyarchaeota archaeon]
MKGISFRRRIRKVKLLNPSLNFAQDTQLVEFRRDPLTGKWICRLNLKRALRVKQVLRESFKEKFFEIVVKSRSECFFCPENIEKSTTMFPSNITLEGRFKVGDAWVFPNLYPFSENHAVCVISKEHFLDLNQFKPEILYNAFKASVKYISTIHGCGGKNVYPIISWNHLPPSAASVIHPHFQLLVESKPTIQVKELLGKSKSYWKRYGENFWVNLVKTEKNLGERFIGETGSIAWLTSFAPQGNNEVLAVFTSASNILEVDDEELTHFSKGICKILRGYHEMGVESFNMTTFSGPLNQKLEYYRLSVKIISRPNFNSYYACDCGFMERFHGEVVVETKPEDVAKRLKEVFNLNF